MTADPPSAGGRDTRLGPLITTIFGLYARGEHNWLSVASVVKLMADLGFEGPAVRSAVSRLKRREVLRSQPHEGAAGYSVADSTLAALAEGDVRIFERARATTEDGWLVVVFSVPESEREKRHDLRTSLTRLGLGTAAPGVWVAPGNLAVETRRTLERRGLAEYVDIFTGDHFAFGDLRSKVRTWWDLDELTELYADFLRRYDPVREAAPTGGTTPPDAFRTYIPMLTQWRRLPYRDPGLPLSLLPPGWNGVTAGALFSELNGLLSAPAREHSLRVIHENS
ncbi:PaaX family transcriptional regulator [Streptomyces pseudovenezuelae]|uniref:Phenylacetic acid degradation operon negative regulatory protein n=1 Tax=Streptomyces pseudovenezuelae TaxID=67350 RepID=A0ABT6LVU0_9ACTN|nr:PaaX family transcriptional regulator C-terminal domain-containing protein [Streptomyces pseudovenezuelae]MDH6220333.1 phenylacetic acid degradation operon negative regulatory protein [Streptomyces pseudovenezuelae]